jgi:hypothetical protein
LWLASLERSRESPLLALAGFELPPKGRRLVLMNHCATYAGFLSYTQPAVCYHDRCLPLQHSHVVWGDAPLACSNLGPCNFTCGMYTRGVKFTGLERSRTTACVSSNTLHLPKITLWPRSRARLMACSLHPCPVNQLVPSFNMDAMVGGDI